MSYRQRLQLSSSTNSAGEQVFLRHAMRPRDCVDHTHNRINRVEEACGKNPNLLTLQEHLRQLHERGNVMSPASP